ncbi:hypothetical protein ACZ90_06985 [Streptomyces albus subsp. albus]|nr:hypothetical protein ACZ90_06985 [Streptomyces albus subsp. albus]
MGAAEETAEFAALLRQLKERSGLSYGALAKRLHMSASTLHRYCKGEAVPHDYAPVERLARVCEATPEELVEAHRRWILADAARGRTPKGSPAGRASRASAGAVAGAGTVSGAGDAPVAETGADTDTGTAPADGTGQGAVAAPEGSGASAADIRDATAEPTSPRAVADPASAGAVQGAASSEATVALAAPGAPGARTASADAARPGGSVPSPGTPEAHAAKTAPSTGEAGDPGGADDAAEAGDPGTPADAGESVVPAAHRSAPPRGSRRRGSRGRVVLAVVGAAAVLGGAAFAMQLGSAGGEERRQSLGSARTDPTAGDPWGAPTRTTKAPSRSASPSASASRAATPSRPTHAATTHGKRPPAPERADGKAGQRGRAVPLTVATRPYDWPDPCSQHYLLDRPSHEVPPPPTEQDAPGWVTAMGAVSADTQRLELTVQGTGRDTVVLRALHVRTVETGAPLPWNSYTMGVGCGGGVDTSSFDVDLDAGRPSVRPAGGQRDFPYKVSESDPEVLYVTAHTASHEVRWYLELEWSSGDRHGTLRVDDRGRPFRTSGESGRPRYEFPIGAPGWTPSPG